MRLASTLRRARTRALPLVLGAAALATASHAAAAQTVVPIGMGAFPLGTTLLTFAGLTTGTEVNGLSVGGVSFTYSLGNGNVIIDGGPGTTNNIAAPNVVSTGNNSGILTLSLPGFSSMFGYGFAILSNGVVADATTITLFSGATNVGALSYAGAPDPSFTGGFAGIQSTVPFNRVDIRFSTAAPAFALDNVRFAATTVPEPATLGLAAAGLCALGLGVQRRRGRTA